MSSPGLIAAEYLVFFSKNGVVESIDDPGVYDGVYKILMRYQWPTSTAYYQFMSPQEKHEYRASLQRAPVQSRQQAQRLVKTFSPVPPSEEQFIRQQLKAIDHRLDIAFVPGFIYELFVLAQYLKDFNFGKNSLQVFGEHESDCFDKLGDEFMALISSPRSNIKDIFRLAIRVNEEPGVIRMHQRMNNEFLEAVRGGLFGNKIRGSLHGSMLKKVLFLDAARAAQNLIGQIKSLLSRRELRDSKYAYVFNFFVNPDNDLPQIASNALVFQKLAYKLNQGLLWRATEIPSIYQVGEKKLEPYEVTYLLGIPKDPKTGKPKKETFLFAEFFRLYSKKHRASMKKGPQLSPRENMRLQELICQEKGFFEWNKPMRTISFGNSPLAGFINDRCACVFFLLSEKEEFNCDEPAWDAKGKRENWNSIGYVVRIDKIDYLVGEASHLFRVAPFSTLLGLFGGWQVFHPISRAPYAGQHGDRIELTGIDFDPARHYLDYFTFPGDPLAFGAQLAQYLAQHSTIFKVTDSNGGFEPRAGARESLREDLKETMRIFRLLDALYVFCIRRRDRGHMALEKLSFELRQLQDSRKNR